MGILPFRKKKELVGIDLGSGAIKALHLRSLGRNLVVEKAGLIETPEGAFQNGIISDIKAIADALMTLWENLDIGNMAAAIAVPGREVIIDMPRLENVEPDNVYNHIRSNPMDFIPYPLEEVYFDCDVVGGHSERGGYEVLLACVKKAILMDFRQIVEQTAISVSVVDVDFFALCNAFETTMGPFDADKVILLLNFGHSSIEIIIALKGIPVYFRSIGNGTEEIVFQLVDNLGLQYHEALSLLKGNKIGKNKEEAEAREIIKYVVNQWFTEIEHNIDYFMELQNIAGIDEAYICGGPACSSGLEDLVEKHLKVPCKTFNPMDYVKAGKMVDSEYLKAIGPQFGVSFGLALRKSGDKKV